MKLYIEASTYSFFLHAMVVVCVFLYSQSSESQRITSTEYLSVSIVNMVSDNFATQTGSATATVSQVSSPTAVPPDIPISKKIENPKESSPLKFVAEKKKIERRIESSKPLKQQKSELATTVAGEKNKRDSLDSANKPEPSPVPINDGQATTTVVGGSGDSADQQKHKQNSGVNGQAAASGSANSLQNRYIRMNYNYIREIVAANLSFPASARKMRLCGKIEVSFLVGTEGGVDDIRITSSSGHTLLDRSVIAAVRRSAPFPESPALARIVLPIAFRLK